MKQVGRALLPLVLLVGFRVPLFAQIAPPNRVGVAAGHEHFRAADPDEADRFWIALGGVHTLVGQRQIVKLPGVMIMVARAAPDAPVTGGTEGSVIDTIAFKVKSLRTTLASLEAAGYKPLDGATRSGAFVMAPHQAKIELIEDPTLPTPVAADALVMRVPNPDDAAAWYAKWFGAEVVPAGNARLAKIPGMNLRFEKAAGGVAGSRGRALDHMGLEVKNLEVFMKRLADGGVKIDRPFSAPPADVTPELKSLAFVSDPWGTYIELNEGFSEVK